MTVEELQSMIEYCEDLILHTKGRIKTARQQFIREHENLGWQRFLFESDVEGVGSPDSIETLFLFRPGIDLTSWKGVTFWHSDHHDSESHEQFDTFIESLVEGEDYIIVP